MKDSKYNIGDLVATYVELDDKNDKLLIGWITKKGYFPINGKHYIWVYDIEWADGMIEEEVEEAIIYNVIKNFREAKRYKRWTRTNWK